MQAECVSASALDPALAADAPVCHCSYDAPNGFSDTGERVLTVYEVGLSRVRAIDMAALDSCEVRRSYIGATDVCLLEGSEFFGCDLGQPATSCLGTCAAVSQADMRTVSELRGAFQLLSARCVTCNSGYCIGAFSVNGVCLSAAQGSLGDGFISRAVPCDAPLLDQEAAALRFYAPHCPEGRSADAEEAGIEPLPPDDAGTTAQARGDGG